MPNATGIPVPILNAFIVIAPVVFFAFPALLLAFGIFLIRSKRHAQMLPAALRLGWLVLGAGGASLLLFLVAAFSRLPVLEWAAVGLLALSLLLCGWFLRKSQGRPLRGVTWILFADILILVAVLPFSVWVANLALRLSTYDNPNEVEVRAALAKNPDDAAAHSSLARIDGRRGDEAGAISEERQVLRVEPDNTDALILLGGRLTQMGRIEEARPVFQKLAARNDAYSDNARRWLARHSEKSSPPLTP